MRLSIQTTPRLRHVAVAVRTFARRLVNRYVPERQIILRTERHVQAVVFTQRAQLWMLGVLLGVIGWSAYATVAVAFHGAIVAAKDREIGAVRMANAALREEMQHAEESFAVVTGRLEAKHAYLVGLMERTGVATAPVSANRTSGKGAPADRLAESREAVRGEIAALDNVLRPGPTPLVAGGIEDILHDRSQALAENSRLQARLGAIEERLGDLHLAQQSTMTQLARRALSNLDEVKAMIVGLGLDVNRVLGRTAGRPQSGVGGPFIPAAGVPPRAAVPASFGSADRALERWEGVQQALRSLPLGAPVDHVAVMSPFGSRIDPFNGLRAIHTGIDLGGVLGTPIHATAPGRVTYVGTTAGYGRMVEIDHGQGLVTRYAHLSRFMVRAGERVHYRQVIGLMGATGRATGVHVHYEVLVNGKPRDPSKFIQAGSYVLVQR